MKIQCLFLKKPLLTGLAYVRLLLHVCFHVIMHGVLLFFYDLAMRADKMAVFILCIRECHGKIQSSVGKGLVSIFMHFLDKMLEKSDRRYYLLFSYHIACA